MALVPLRRRLPLPAFILLALLCVALLGFACACLTDHPMQAIERALAAVPALPALVEVWSPAALMAFATLFVLAVSALRRPSAAALQRFLL